MAGRMYRTDTREEEIHLETVYEKKTLVTSAPIGAFEV